MTFENVVMTIYCGACLAVFLYMLIKLAQKL